MTTALFTNLLQSLREPIEPRLIKSREGWTDYAGNKHMVEYVEWHTVADILDTQAPMWAHTIRHITQIGETIVVVAAITIASISREGIGTGNAGTETGIKKAEHDALKRAAIKFGIARDLYHRERGATPEHKPSSRPRPANLVASSVSDFATPKQVVKIRALCRELGIEAERELPSALKVECTVAELSRRAASLFIDHLLQL